MDRALWVAEVLRRKVQGLHQIVNVTEKKIVDVYEPLEEGLITVRQERFLTILEVTLTLEPTQEQTKHAGYHAPLNIKSDFLTKDTWAQNEKERAERRTQGNGEDRPRRDNRENREDRPRRPREDKPREDRPNRGADNREQRGGERRRGRD